MFMCETMNTYPRDIYIVQDNTNIMLCVSQSFKYRTRSHLILITLVY